MYHKHNNKVSQLFTHKIILSLISVTRVTKLIEGKIMDFIYHKQPIYICAVFTILGYIDDISSIYQISDRPDTISSTDY